MGKRMSREMTLLHPGSCESLKACVHAAALGLAAVMGLYNAAAWLARRESHLAVNAVCYGALVAWERHHVAHHVTARREPRGDTAAAAGVPGAAALAA
jgi:hypothetical protein